MLFRISPLSGSIKPESGGVFFLGSPRRFPYQNGSKQYQINSTDIGELGRWWAAYQIPAIRNRLDDTRNSMRQADLRAAHYYGWSHTQADPVDRLINLAIALEAMFSPTDKQELSYRIALYAAQLVGETPQERVDLFKELKGKLYDRRSALMHGSYDVEKYLAGRFVTHDECDNWASIIRRCTLRILTLYLRGRHDKSGISQRPVPRCTGSIACRGECVRSPTPRNFWTSRSGTNLHGRIAPRERCRRSGARAMRPRLRR